VLTLVVQSASTVEEGSEPDCVSKEETRCNADSEVKNLGIDFKTHFECAFYA